MSHNVITVIAINQYQLGVATYIQFYTKKYILFAQFFVLSLFQQIYFSKKLQLKEGFCYKAYLKHDFQERI